MGVSYHRFAPSTLSPSRRLDNTFNEKKNVTSTNFTALSDHEKDGRFETAHATTTLSRFTSNPASLLDKYYGSPVDPRTWHSALEIVQTLKPIHPVILIRPNNAVEAAKEFKTLFSGQAMYAVKANDCPGLLQLLYGNGITWFDVCSINEAKHVKSVLPESTLCFMNPVKPREAIREAYSYGVRVFSLDSTEELDNIVQSTSQGSKSATDLTLCVRVQVRSRHAKWSLGSKFGVSGQEAKALLQRARPAAKRLGICFHVGSQAMSPEDFQDALRQVSALAVDAGVNLEIVDLAGGWAVKYPDMDPPPLSEYMESIYQTFCSLSFGPTTKLWAEPGRWLSAKYHSLIGRVEKRRGLDLYLNTGSSGVLYDAMHLKWRYFVKLLRDPPSDKPNLPFSFYGPTCDNDYMPGPFYLPADTAAGDYIEIEGVGAYGWVLRSSFNGYNTFEIKLIQD